MHCSKQHTSDAQNVSIVRKAQRGVRGVRTALRALGAELVHTFSEWMPKQMAWLGDQVGGLIQGLGLDELHRQVQT